MQFTRRITRANQITIPPEIRQAYKINTDDLILLDLVRVVRD